MRLIEQYIVALVKQRPDAGPPGAGAALSAALLSVYGQLPRLIAAGRLTAHSVAEQLDCWWHGFFSFLASGPPGFRLAPAADSVPGRDRPLPGRRHPPTDGHVIDPSLDSPHPRRIALGAHTNSRAVAAFARPRTNAPAFRQNDAVARALLRALSVTEADTAASPVDGRPLRV